MFTKQETFDIVVAHLRKQGKKAGDAEGCMYRAPDGCMCAAGCLIPDEDYDPNMERGIATSLLVATVLLKQGHDIRLVRDLQIVHDNSPMFAWENALMGVAESSGLVYHAP